MEKEHALETFLDLFGEKYRIHYITQHFERPLGKDLILMERFTKVEVERVLKHALPYVDCVADRKNTLALKLKG